MRAKESQESYEAAVAKLMSGLRCLIPQECSFPHRRTRWASDSAHDLRDSGRDRKVKLKVEERRSDTEKAIGLQINPILCR